MVTDQQVNDLVVEFDTNMFPKETAAFSTPPDRDGTNATIDGDFTGDGDKTVTLVDNVRDDNFYDFPAASTYIAGFFSTAINNYTDRNVMTIDAFDWAHRTGANPPNEVTDDPCTSRPARPRAYEGTFAHEWQHLLLSYVDPDELTWVDEGLADYAQYLVGYSNTAATVYEPGQDVHLVCFQGFGPVQTDYNNPRDCGGPENSLNLWGESPNPAAVLADYGNAYEFMQFLHDRYGADFLTALHRDADLQGLASVAALAKKEGVKDVHDLIHDYQSMVLLDKVVGGRWGVSLGVPKNRVTSASLNSTVNLANPASYATPGAAPNGADYVLLQDRNGKALKAGISARCSSPARRRCPPSRWSGPSSPRPGPVGQPGAVLRQREQHRRRRDLRDHRAGGRPDAELPREVRRRDRLRLRVRLRVDGRRQDLHGHPR